MQVHAMLHACISMRFSGRRNIRQRVEHAPRHVTVASSIIFMLSFNSSRTLVPHRYAPSGKNCESLPLPTAPVASLMASVASARCTSLAATSSDMTIGGQGDDSQWRLAMVQKD
jgi:hypothetical protein